MCCIYSLHPNIISSWNLHHSQLALLHTQISALQHVWHCVSYLQFTGHKETSKIITHLTMRPCFVYVATMLSCLTEIFNAIFSRSCV